MGLETGTYLNDLVNTNPVATDNRSEGDDHIRLIKKVLLNTFPGMSARAWRELTKSSNYTLAETDNMTIVRASAAITLNLTAVATIGNGFIAAVYADGGIVTINPSGTEDINHSSTSLALPENSAGILFCDGTQWHFFYLEVAQAILKSFLTATGSLITASAAATPYEKLAGANNTFLTYRAGADGGMAQIYPGQHDIWNAELAVSHSTNDMTIALKNSDGDDASLNSPIIVTFPGSGMTGQISTSALTAALSLTIPAGATLGSTATPTRLWVILINDGGTLRLGVVNCLDRSTTTIHRALSRKRISAVAIDTASDSAGVVYADATVTAKTFRVLGFIQSPSKAAGANWPSTDSWEFQPYAVGSPLPGDTVQEVYDFDGTLDANPNTNLPVDGSIPLTTEGELVMSVSITPENACDVLEFDSQIIANSAAAAGVAGASLGFDNGSEAIVAAAPLIGDGGAGAFMIGRLFTREIAGAESACTFNVRIGPSAGATNLYFNAEADGTQLFTSGSCNSFCKVREIMV